MRESFAVQRPVIWDQVLLLWDINHYSTGTRLGSYMVCKRKCHAYLNGTTPVKELMRKISAMRPAYTSRQVLLITSRKRPGNELI